LIDVGCGRGDLLFFLEEQCPGLRLTGTDLIANVHPRITFREENVFTATFAEQYDAVTCLQHFRPHYLHLPTTQDLSRASPAGMSLPPWATRHIVLQTQMDT
jgi:2-polyprenyl-3-methyl-5-hydroxy-6-metoxy-1,4-benzoquinol methylase